MRRLEQQQTGSLFITDINGVEQKNIDLKSEQKELSFNTNDWNKGLYFLVWRNDQTQDSQHKILVVK